MRLPLKGYFIIRTVLSIVRWIYLSNRNYKWKWAPSLPELNLAEWCRITLRLHRHIWRYTCVQADLKYDARVWNGFNWLRIGTHSKVLPVRWWTRCSSSGLWHRVDLHEDANVSEKFCNWRWGQCVCSPKHLYLLTGTYSITAHNSYIVIFTDVRTLNVMVMNSWVIKRRISWADDWRSAFQEWLLYREAS